MNYTIIKNYLLTLCMISIIAPSLLASKDDLHDNQEASLKRKRESEPTIPNKIQHTDAEELKKSLPSNESAPTTTVQSFVNFEDYTTQMRTQGLPLILVVGCGHGVKYKHTHLNSWCVNLEKDPSFGNMEGNTPEAFKLDVQADETLDISDFSKPVNRTLTRDQIPYKNTFDVIILERPLPATLNKPWTLWNVAHMLKPGGQLIIDTCQGYRSERYAIGEDNPFRSVCVDDAPNNGAQKQHNLFQTNLFASDFLACLKQTDIKTFNLKAVEVVGRQTSFYGEGFDVTPIAKKLARFGVQQDERLKVNHDMSALGNFLARWFFTDIINVEDAYQPYTINLGEPLETARKTNIISATKTQETEDALAGWREKIRAIRGHIFWK